AEADHSQLHVLALLEKTVARLKLLGGAGRRMNVGVLEEFHEFEVARRDHGDSLFPRRLLHPPSDQRIPEIGATDREAYEARTLRRGSEPVPHLRMVLAAAKNDAADLVAAAGSRGRHDRPAILAAIKALDLPYVRIDAGILELADGLDHQVGPQLEIIGLRVALELVELRLLRRHQELEHEATAFVGGEKIGQAFQSGGLPLVQRAIALRIIAHQHLTEGRVEGLDMAREILAILEVELLLSALLRRAGGDDALGSGIAEDGGAELLVHQDAGAPKKKAGILVDEQFGAAILRD